MPCSSSNVGLNDWARVRLMVAHGLTVLRIVLDGDKFGALGLKWVGINLASSYHGTLSVL